jgi:cell division septal protein FtsQ
MLIPRWFFGLSGLILIIVGVSLILVRPRPKYERGMARIINLGHIWAGTCVLVGLAVILYALGVIAWPPRR